MAIFVFQWQARGSVWRRGQWWEERRRSPWPLKPDGYRMSRACWNMEPTRITPTARASRHCCWVMLNNTEQQTGKNRNDWKGTKHWSKHYDHRQVKTITVINLLPVGYIRSNILWLRFLEAEQWASVRIWAIWKGLHCAQQLWDQWVRVSCSRFYLNWKKSPTKSGKVYLCKVHVRVWKVVYVKICQMQRMKEREKSQQVEVLSYLFVYQYV